MDAHGKKPHSYTEQGTCLVHVDGPFKELEERARVAHRVDHLCMYACVFVRCTNKCAWLTTSSHNVPASACVFESIYLHI